MANACANVLDQKHSWSTASDQSQTGAQRASRSNCGGRAPQFPSRRVLGAIPSSCMRSGLWLRVDLGIIWSHLESAAGIARDRVHRSDIRQRHDARGAHPTTRTSEIARNVAHEAALAPKPEGDGETDARGMLALRTRNRQPEPNGLTEPNARCRIIKMDHEARESAHGGTSTKGEQA